MKLIQEPHLSPASPCSYLPEEMWRFEYFYASDVSRRDLNELLKRGWRKFGYYFFRPRCGQCKKCIPIRVQVSDFKPSKSQRRVVRRCSQCTVEFKDLVYRDEIYEIYSDHSLSRFGKKTDPEDFRSTFFAISCPSLQSEYYIDDRLVAVGFLDMSGEALSSVYFIYRTSYDAFGLGTFSVIKEIEYASALGLEYYYLGYFIEENTSMSYKNNFRPNEKYDWINNLWL